MWCTKALEDIRRQLHSNLNLGITQAEAKERLKKYGLNKLEDRKKESIFVKFIKQFNDFMIIILLIASVISAVISKINGTNDYMDSIIIIAIVVFNAIMGLVQEYKAEKSLEALKNLSSPIAKVKRDGKITEINVSEVVPGDIVILEAGNYVPADCRLIKAYNLQVEESALTGETVPVLKDATLKIKEEVTIADMKNCAFSTTIVTNGHAEAIVTDTGMNTKVGSIAKMIISNEAPQTPIQKKLEEVSKILGMICLGVCGFIFLIGMLKEIPIVEMFMTSIGLAVAAIPEGLPAIVTIMLSIGVTKMAKKDAIIKKLPAVETLGSSRVICSDKTGTLTQNKMKVVQTHTISKQDENFAIRLACMCTDCSTEYEKGKKIIKGDPTEIAIVNKALENGDDKNKLYEEMERIAEIPFDSNRKLMTTIHKVGNKYRIITKGAPDMLLKRCTKFYDKGSICTLNNSHINKLNIENNKMAQKALRVLAVAFLDIDTIPKNLNSETLENNLIFTRINRYD